MIDVAKQYAIALFSLASEKKQMDQMDICFKAFIEGLDNKAWQFFLNPKVKDLDKHAVIEKVIDEKLFVDFLKVVINNKRFVILKDIAKSYKVLLNEENKIAELVVYTKTSLSKENKEKIKNKFNKILNKKIVINEVVTPNIVGGIRIEYQGKVIDQTINASLEQLKSSLIG